MPTPTTSHILRSILEADLEMPADAVIQKAKARGVTAPDSSLRPLLHTVRSRLKKAAVLPAPSAAHQTSPPKHPAAQPASPSPANLGGIFANVTLVNAVVGACGGVDQARQVAEAVRSCGGVDEFLLHLALVAGIRS